MQERYTPEAGQGPRKEPEPTRALRIKEEQPGGFMGFLIWWRKRGGVFWWMSFIGILSIALLVFISVWIARSAGQLDFRAPPDFTVSATARLADPAKNGFSTGDAVTLTVGHQNIGGSEAGSVAVDIYLPDQLTAVNAQPGGPACSEAGRLGRFATGAIHFPGEPGGTVRCTMGTRQSGATGDIILETTVGEVADGQEMDVEVWVTTGTTRDIPKSETIWNNNCTALTLVAGPDAGRQGFAVEKDMDCRAVALVDRSLSIEAADDETEVSPNSDLILSVAYENVDGPEEGTVTVDIELPGEITLTSVRGGGRARTAYIPSCVHSSQFGAFPIEEVDDDGSAVEVTGAAGGVLRCLVNTRDVQQQGELTLGVRVGQVASGTQLGVNACARSVEAAARAATDSCKTLALRVP